MGGVKLYFQVGVECDKCGAFECYPYEIDLIAAARSGGFGKPKQLRQIKREISEAAEKDRWLMVGSSAYCPKCADELDGKRIAPVMTTIDARGALDSLRLMAHLKKNGPEDEK